MARAVAARRQALVVYCAGVAQGIALVTFPAVSTVLTDPSDYDLSSTQYGMLFLPQVVAAIAASLLGARMGARLGIKRVYLAGLAASLVSMLLLLTSVVLIDEKTLAFGLLLLATACLGTGFGLAVPALNTLAAALHPGGVDRSILTLNALLGLGTVLAPVFTALFTSIGAWWGLPVTSAALLVALLGASTGLPLRAGTSQRSQAKTGIPKRFWIYAAFITLYGVCETVNGNWSQLDMTQELGASAGVASLALTAFWAMVTLGRLLFAALQRVVPHRVTFHGLPFLLAAVFVAIAVLPKDDPALSIVAFGLAGLGCSALLPLTISFGQEELTSVEASVAGGVIAFYQLGYGIAAFGVGPLRSAGIDLPTIYALAAVVAGVAGLLSFAVAGGRPNPRSLHAAPRVSAT